MEFTHWQRGRLAAVLGDMAGTPAQVERVAPLMDMLEVREDLAPAGDYNLPITPEQAQMLLKLREAAQMDPPGGAAATPAR